MSNLGVDGAVKTIKKYFNGKNSLPFFVAVDNDNEYMRVKDALSEVSNTVRLSEYCRTDDAYPDLDALLLRIRNTNECITLIGLCDYLRFVGEQEAEKTLYKLKDLPLSTGKVVVVCRRMRSFIEKLRSNDPRFDNRRVCFLSPSQDTNTITIIPNDFPLEAHNGFKALLAALEIGDIGPIFVKTTLIFSNSLYSMKIVEDAYEGMKLIDPSFDAPYECGNHDQWTKFLDELSNYGTIHAVFAQYGFEDKLDLLFRNYGVGNEYENWLYFIALKAKGTDNEYLSYILTKTLLFEDFGKNVLLRILDISPQDPRFRNLYEDRKILAKEFPESELAEFVARTKIKAEDRIYYLTDNTLIERQAIIECFAEHELPFDILSDNYPVLYDYLRNFSFNCGELSDLLSAYFTDYKRQKLLNKIDPGFLRNVLENASKREFYLLPTRNEALEKINATNSCLYFIDALGVEFLGFIQATCAQMELRLRVEIARANLPTITSLNKDFYDNWVGNKVHVRDLDKIKHKDEGGFDYQRTKLPIHLAKELDIIVSVLDRAKTELALRNSERVIITSDHGASRLAVINGQELKYDVDSKGMHSGRCCEVCNLEGLEYATEENDYWVLANYGRFKGSRAASVEVHGGASLEEVVVPVIELTLINDKIEICLEKPIITTSFRKKAEVTLFSLNILDNVSVVVDSKKYIAQKLDENRHKIVFPDIQRAGTYAADVFDNDNLIGKIEFTVRKESAHENDLF